MPLSTPRAITLLAAIVPFATGALAQAELPPPTPGTVTGTLLDGELDEPLGFASVAALDETGTILTGVTTDIDGAYRIEGLDVPGEYRLAFSFVGYADDTLAVSLTEAQPTASLEPLILSTGGVDLATAVVTEERALMELGLDRKVFNVESNIAAAGGSATDLLRNLPSVTVDLDGNVSLRGSQNVRFLINGRPSGLTSGDPATFLQSLSAANVERIEVITNPGAGFDPEGTAGLINIVLKRERADGLNGSATVNVGTNDKYDGNLSLNYRVGDWNPFLTLGGRYDVRDVEGFRDQELYDSTGALESSRFITFGGFRQNTGLTFRGGTEYNYSATGRINVQATYQYGEGEAENTRTFAFFDAEGVPTGNSIREEFEPEIEREYEFRADFEQDLPGEGHGLSGVLQYGYSGEEETENYDENIFDVTGAFLERVRQNAPVDEERIEMLGQLDYERRVDAGGALGEVGLAAGWRSTIERLETDAVFNDYLPASDAFAKVDSFSNLFQYDEDVHALYATAAAEPGKWSLSAGLRAEQAFTTAATLEPVEQAETFENDYFELYPSVYVGRDLSDDLQAQVSYSRRINRPRSRQLNPFVDRGDPLNLRAGNPFLLPEIINSYEANVQRRFERGTLTTGLYFRDKSELISRISETLDDGVNLATAANLASGRDYGLEVIATFRATEALEFSFSGNAYRTEIDGELAEGAIDVDGYLGDARGQVNAELPWGISGQATYFYRSPGVRPQGSIDAIHSLDVGLRRDVLAGRGAVTLRVSDVFDTREYNFVSDVDGLLSETRYKRESRIAYLGFQYRFGVDADKRPREERGGGRRDGGGGDDDF